MSPLILLPATGRRLPAALLALAGLAAIVAVAAAACGGGSSQEVSRVEAILDGPVRVENITATGATVRATTSIPVVCSVVYGTDGDYGAISTDLDMGGTAHADHAAPLRGLAPNTVYHFRLQGTGADGTLYVSEDMTFRTPPEGDDGLSPAGENLASAAAGARIMAVSSVFGDAEAWAAENAIDGDPSTQWSSQGDGDDAFITVKLGQESRIRAVGLWSRTMGSSAEIREFRVITDQGEILGPFTLPDATHLYTFEVETVAQWLRFEAVTSSGGNTGAVEVVAYGERVGEP